MIRTRSSWVSGQVAHPSAMPVRAKCWATGGARGPGRTGAGRDVDIEQGPHTSSSSRRSSMASLLTTRPALRGEGSERSCRRLLLAAGIRALLDPMSAVRARSLITSPNGSPWRRTRARAAASTSMDRVVRSHLMSVHQVACPRCWPGGTYSWWQAHVSPHHRHGSAATAPGRAGPVAGHGHEAAADHAARRSDAIRRSV